MSGKQAHNYGKSPFFYGKTHYKWPCSIAMLVYQRVHVVGLEKSFDPPLHQLDPSTEKNRGHGSELGYGLTQRCLAALTIYTIQIFE